MHCPRTAAADAGSNPFVTQQQAAHPRLPRVTQSRQRANREKAQEMRTERVAAKLNDGMLGDNF